jgi:hypothetical protein
MPAIMMKVIMPTPMDKLDLTILAVTISNSLRKQVVAFCFQILNAILDAAPVIIEHIAIARRASIGFTKKLSLNHSGKFRFILVVNDFASSPSFARWGI